MQPKSENEENRRRVPHPGFGVAVRWVLVLSIAAAAYWATRSLMEFGENVAAGVAIVVVVLGIVIMSRQLVTSSLRRRPPN